ncbi:TPM domain-containing protein [Lacticaseibacillus jixianensis]|uniref:TPM domain-containing protein n=1 Tax=Lacticaseibacillus jixianensis TaxID=2486012 RepID=A0ABW4B882_9LACO|nr:TPM domain-containing protein [Lacticaseibacillus jixianensis]
MKKRWLSVLFLLPLMLIFARATPVQAVSYPDKPTGGTYYTDELNLLAPKTQQLIDDKNHVWEQTKQQPAVAVAVIKSSGGEDLGEYAPALFSRWGVGQKASDNGVLLVYADNDGAQNLFIEVGYGLEGNLPDATAGRILQANKAKIKSKDPAKVNQGLRNVFNAVATIIDKKYKFKTDKNAVTASQLAEYQGQDEEDDGGGNVLGGIFGVLITVAVLAMLFSGGNNHRGGRGGGGSGFWLWWLLGDLLSSSNRDDHWGGGSGFGGGGGFGGGSGGGFGGGSSGGGGAGI